MEKIVSDGLKTDLHIHSFLSHFKDGDKVSYNTLERINVLIEKLNVNRINLCALTDHDAFSYDLYSCLKNEEGKGSIKKVLPGVEFAIQYIRNESKKIIHVITLFDDANQEKLKNLEKILMFKDGNPVYDLKDQSCFSEKRFLEMLNDIGLNCLCIAHQKHTLESKKASDHDANTLGREAFNEFLFADYFEAYEFKNRKNEVFNNVSKAEFDGDLLRFITGSDCHVWSEYPKYDKDDSSSFSFTYLKCLPTFKGVALAMTEDSRISLQNNFYNTANIQMHELKIRINSEVITIPMSAGINVLIGDNSIGKSLLLHKITGYYRENTSKELSSLDSNLKKKYEEYLSVNNIEVIKPSLDQSKIFGFDTQGEIRKKFDLRLLKKDNFFADKYPEDIPTLEAVTLVKTKVEKELKKLQEKFMFDEKYNLIPSLQIPNNILRVTCLQIQNIDITSFTNFESKYSQVNENITAAIIATDTLEGSLEDPKEKAKLTEFRTFLENLKTKYKFLNDNITSDIKIINCLSLSYKEFEDTKAKIMSSEDSSSKQYNDSINGFATSISESLKHYLQISEIDFSVKEIELKPVSRPYLNHDFNKKVNCSKVDNEYIKSILYSPLKKGKDLCNILSITKDTFIDYLFRFDNSSEPLEFYREKLKSKIDEDFKIISTITIKTDNPEDNYSQGLNSKIYFDILSTQKGKNGVYIIDQPEDDISPKSISDFVLKDFKAMSKQRQILLVTHNPQFVVNLDADNIISLSRDKKTGEFRIKSGSLEYEDDESKTNILDIVASSLEGGIESIKKRWKRYEKGN